MHVGVLALQGAFREHILALEALGARVDAIRLPEQLDGLDGLVIPGGESTTIGTLMDIYCFHDPIRDRHDDGMAVWGTCAGAILVAEEILDPADGQRPLALMDIAVRRNAYGRQVDSFEADLSFDGLEGPDAFRGVFIRAPWIERVGAGVRALATHDGVVVAARQDDMLATVFHPELTGDPRVHRYFLEEVVGSTGD